MFGWDKWKTRTEALLQGVPYFHSLPVDGRTVLTDEHLGDFWRSRGIIAIRCPSHGHVRVWWLGLVSIVGWDHCLWGIVPRVTSTKRGRTNVDDESRNLI